MKRLIFIVSFSVCFGYNSLNITTNWAIDFYKKFISPLQGKQICNFSPTCSQYYKQSINRYGIVIGSLMGANRLMRCNPYAWTYLDKYYYGIDNDRIYDPPENQCITYKNADRQSLTANNIIAENGERIADNGLAKADSELAFADYLFQQQDFPRAIAEYKRLLYFYPDTQKNIWEYVQLMLGESYLKIKDYPQALAYFSLQESPYYNYNRARVYYEQGNYQMARDELDKIINFDFDEKSIILYGLSFYKENSFKQGSEFLKKNLPRKLSIIDRFTKFDGSDINTRSRLASTFFSIIIPGLGQTYSGRLGDGIYSFLTVVGCGLIANYYYHNDESRIKFSIFSALTTFFWAGNVYGANIAARDYNTYQVSRYQKNIADEVSDYNFMPNYKSKAEH